MKPSRTSALLSQSTVGKKYVVHWGTLSFKFARLLFTTRSWIINIHSLAALVAIAQDVFSARSLRPGNSNRVVATTAECLYTNYVQSEACTRPNKFFIIFCMYNKTAWLYFCNFKFDIYDAMFFSTCLPSSTDFHVSSDTSSCKTDF